MSGLSSKKTVGLAPSPTTGLGIASLPRSKSAAGDLPLQTLGEKMDRRNSSQGLISPKNTYGHPGCIWVTDPLTHPAHAASASSNISDEDDTKTITGAHARLLRRQRSTPSFSPAAPSFQPRKGATSQMALLNKESIPDNEPQAPVASTSTHPLSTITEASSSSGVRTHPSISDRRAGKQPVTRSQEGPDARASQHYLPPFPRARFTTDEIPDQPGMGGHYVKVDKITALEFEYSMHHLETRYGWADSVIAKKAYRCETDNDYMSTVLCFDSLHDASKAKMDVQRINPSWEVKYISQPDFQQIMGAGVTFQYDGQLYFHAAYTGKFDEEIDFLDLQSHVLQLAKDYGEVVAFDCVSNTGRTRLFRVEYSRITSAREALRDVAGEPPHYHGEWTVCAKAIGETKEQSPLRAVNKQEYHILSTPRKMSQSDSGHMYTSPTGRTAWRATKNGKVEVLQAPLVVPKVYHTPAAVAGPSVMHSAARSLSAESPETSADFGSGQRQAIARGGNWSGSWRRPQCRDPFDNDRHRTMEQQMVSIDKILNGVDVRTTVMLRNVPNHWTVDDLKFALDRTSRGCYDFSYLRIDFERGTNVGYAFVNFAEASDIVPFFQCYIGREWQPGSYGNKRAQVSYATVQGYDCLVQKFRNSAIMDEFYGYRPKLWWSRLAAEAEGMPHLVGQERDFPVADNLSKKQRSHDNASHVGLYQSRSAQRGSDRHRRSQYDRGTTSQIQEDAMLMSQGSPGYVYNQNNHGVMGHPPPAFGGWAPMYAALPGYGPPQYYPPMPPMDFNAMRFAGQDPFVQGPYGPVPFYNGNDGSGMPYNNMHYPPHTLPGTINPASGLRTISRGRLGGRPRNVTTMPNAFDGTAAAGPFDGVQHPPPAQQYYHNPAVGALPAGTDVFGVGNSQSGNVPRVFYQQGYGGTGSPQGLVVQSPHQQAQLNAQSGATDNAARPQQTVDQSVQSA